MPKCALPSNIDEPSEWKGTDDDKVWWMRWRLYCKFWWSFSHRCPKGITGTIIFFPGLYVLPLTIWFTGWSWWYMFPLIVLPVLKQWDRFPHTILAIRSKQGAWRIEADGAVDTLDSRRVIWWTQFNESYLSRVQYWTRWHFQWAWPFLIAFHWYWKAEDVPAVMERIDTDGKLWFCYRGYHRDGDQVFWGDGGFLGRCWK
jgi:hypothetical protein